jgi:hypothetical protein
MSKVQRRTSIACILMPALLAGCGAAGTSDTLVVGVGTNAVGGSGASAAQYSSFAGLTGDQLFDALVVKTSDQFFDGSEVKGRILFDAAKATYTVDAFGFPIESFPKVGTAPASPRDFYVGTGPAGDSKLTYTQFAYWYNNSPGVSGDYRAVIGVPTKRGDYPAIGTATYRQTGIQGTAYQSGGPNGGIYSIGNSKVDLSLDFATQIALTKIELIGTPRAGGVDVNFGTYTGKRDSIGIFPLYRTGALPGNYSGFWDVTFFGPQAQEYGLIFSIDERVNGVQMDAGGAVVGTRN